MSKGGFTPDQQRAVREVGRSLLVSAAAGSGKTTVLAERCAELICDPADGKPCQASEILVVTFTDAAAAHMRGRIGDALRKRLDGHPRRQYIEEQLALLPAAPISTIHSFCRDLIRRWFTVARIDPQADVLDAEEALLLQHETIDALLHELYGSRSDEALAFQRLVEEDFNGNDTALVELVLRLHDFVRSVPDSDGWLRRVGERFDESDPERLARAVHEMRARRLAREVALQRVWLDGVLNEWSAQQIDACVQLQQLVAYRAAIGEWEATIREADTPDALDGLCASITAYEMNARGGRKKSQPKLDEPLLERAKGLYDRARRGFLGGRLRDGCARFSGAEYADGMIRVAPRLRTLTWLVGEFGRRYTEARRADNVLDFSDLEQLAFRILAEHGDAARPSEVARRCHERYRHVLVDEFQDTNPIQEAILRLVSRETAADHEDNLFAVGDVKQCIYAFRLAEPRLFLDRAARFGRGDDGLLISLRENFRSRGAVLDGVNAVFERCMTAEFADVRYDQDAALRAGLTYPSPSDRPSFAHMPVELHLLERPPSNRGSAAPDEEEGEADEGEAAETVLDWHRVEREAHLIGQRIREFMGSTPGGRRRVVCEPSKESADGFAVRELQYRDIVVLVRATKEKAERIADVLQQMDIPVHADVRSGYFDTAELRDMLALLSLLDNGQQDIPLAGVLRSPLAAPREFSASDLVKIRVHGGRMAFHAAAVRYAGEGADAELRGRLQEFFSRIERFRLAARRRGLADVIWEIYEETGYLAYVGGLPHGRQRRANLIGLHDRARQFGTFRRQGLRRFLHFIEQLREREEDLGTPSAASEADDVVRILSVHQSKGLEFPVVFVADLGAKFNLGDIRRSVIMHREAGVGMRVVDAEGGITYPSLAYQAVGDAISHDTRAEELRILYVAMTRAKEHLVLVGTAGAGAIRDAIDSPQRAVAGQIDCLTLAAANTPLDWLLAVVGRLPAEAIGVCPSGEAATCDSASLFAVFHHDLEAMQGWELTEELRVARRAALAKIAELGPLPDGEPVNTVDAGVHSVIERLEYHYGPLAMTTVPARQTVSELKRQFDPFTESEERAEGIEVGAAGSPRFRLPRPPLTKGERRSSSALDTAVETPAAQRGIVTHRFLQCIDLAAAGDERAIGGQLAALVRAGRLPAEAEGLIDVPAVAWFFAGDLGRRLRAAAERVRREVTFVTRISPALWDGTIEPHDGKDVILVRGMIDALVPGPDGVELIDYKTDAVAADQVAERAVGYKMQVDMYARAIEAIWRRPVTARWLVFLSARQIVSA